MRSRTCHYTAHMLACRLTSWSTGLWLLMALIGMLFWVSLHDLWRKMERKESFIQVDQYNTEVALQLPSISNTELRINLIFTHMRKAGGSHLINIMNQMMLNHRCINSKEVVGTMGVRAGVPLDILMKKPNYTFSGNCPHVNMVRKSVGLLIELP